jgi:hypothetical protein
MNLTIERVLACVEGSAQSAGRRIDLLVVGDVPASVLRAVLVTGAVRRIVPAGDVADLALVQLAPGASIEEAGYLAPNGCVLFDPRVVAPIEAIRGVRRAWVDQQPWVFPLEGEDAFREGVILCSQSMRSDIPRISCSMPVNLERHDVERVLASFLPVAQEWVVGVDEKSDDGTLAIVERYADVVFRFRIEPWSFAEARNRTVDRCSFPWIFQTEGHEHLSPEGIGGLRILSGISLPQGVLMVAREIKGGDHGENDQVFFFPWIFRNHPSLRFVDQNGVHNALDIEVYAKAIGAKEPVVVRADARIRTIHKAHPTNRHARAVQRHGMNREALDTYADAATDRVRKQRALFYAQQEHASAGDLRKATRVGIQYIRTKDRFHEQLYEGHIRVAEYLIAMKKPRFAIAVAKRALPLDTNRVEAEVILGDAYQLTGDYEAARQSYAKAAGVPMPAYSHLFVRKAYYEGGPWKGLASVCYRLGDVEKAKNAATAALFFDPEDAQCKELAALELVGA